MGVWPLTPAYGNSSPSCAIRKIINITNGMRYRVESRTPRARHPVLSPRIRRGSYRKGSGLFLIEPDRRFAPGCHLDKVALTIVSISFSAPPLIRMIR